MPDTQTTDFTAELLAGAQDFRTGWTTADGRVVVVMSPEHADHIARLIVQSTRAAEDQLAEHRWIHAAIGLITAAAHADLPTQPNVQLVPKVDLPPTAADLDARDQANVTPNPETEAPRPAETAKERTERVQRAACLEEWPDARSMEYDPRCCRFPKSCSIPDAPAERSEAPAGWLSSRFVDCVCGDRHPYDGHAFDVPADGRMHGLVEP
jgi:hypothetical protein